jgi:hypothetical protein
MVVVPAASNTLTPTTIAVFAFVHAISFKAPLMRVKVELLAAVPLAIAAAVHFAAHAADDALTLLRIHSRTLYNARAACKMVCEVR